LKLAAASRKKHGVFISRTMDDLAAGNHRLAYLQQLYLSSVLLEVISNYGQSRCTVKITVDHVLGGERDTATDREELR
jgi:hypothetical protein